jgi:hypothetical protein
MRERKKRNKKLKQERGSGGTSRCPERAGRGISRWRIREHHFKRVSREQEREGEGGDV